MMHSRGEGRPRERTLVLAQEAANKLELMLALL